MKNIKTRPARPKFIDRLEKELQAAGIQIKRGGMTDYSFDKNGKRSDNYDDNCEWVTIILKSEDESKKYEVEFFFNNDSKKLESVHLYVKKKKKGYGGGELIAIDKPMEPIKITKPDTIAITRLVVMIGKVCKQLNEVVKKKRRHMELREHIKASN